MYSDTKITFTVGIEIDEDEIDGVEKIIKFLEDLIQKAKDREVERQNKRVAFKAKVEKIEDFNELLTLPKDEEKTEKTDRNSSVTCECGAIVVLRNMNRHKRTVKHINFEKSKV